MVDDYLQRVKDQEINNAQLYTRFKEDEDLLYLLQYVMKDADNQTVPDIVNVTLNRPAVFAASVISGLGSTSEQRVVETEDKTIDTTEIENFQKAAFATANDRLRRQGRPQINPFFDTQLSIRGRGSARCVFQMVDDVLVTEIDPWDTLSVTYEMGTDGLAWGAFKQKKTKGVVEAEAWFNHKNRIQSITISGKNNVVLDVWDTTHNEIWLNSKKVFEQEHPFGFTPVVVGVVPLGYGAILLSEDSIKNEGESIFFLIRSVLPELNRLASIMQTLNLKSVKPPAQWESKDGQDFKAVPKHAMDAGAMTAADIGGGAKLISFGDAQRSANIAMRLFDEAIGEGSLSSADLGLIGSPPASGIRAIIAGENKDQLLLPRLEAKALLNESLAEMFTKQVILIGGSVELGVPGHKRSFNTSKLKGEYTTTYTYLAKSPVTDAGLASLSAAMGDSVSDKYKREHILKLEDPEGEERQLNWEKAGRINPRVEQRRIIKDLIEMGEDEDAKLMLDDLGISLQQLLAGEASTLKPEKEDQPTQVLSLFGGGGGGGAPQARTEEEE